MQIATIHQPKPEPDNAISLSVVIAVSRNAEAADMLRAHRDVFNSFGLNYEVLCMANPEIDGAVANISELAKDWPELQLFSRRPWTGEDSELATAYRRAKGALILTLPEWPDVEPPELAKLFEAIDGQDMVVCVRDNQPISGTRQAVMKKSYQLFLGHSVSDVFCRVRLCRREVLDEIGGFGVRQHFLPAIAANRGYRVVEADVKAAKSVDGRPAFVFKPMGHLRAFFDALTLFVVLKFMHRPLRFFGSIGLPIFLVGASYTIWLLIERLFLGASLSDRPALIFSVLMVVLGVQIIALGLVGEIIIFSNSRQIKQYKVSTIIRGDGTEARETPHVADDE